MHHSAKCDNVFGELLPCPLFVNLLKEVWSYQFTPVLEVLVTGRVGGVRSVLVNTEVNTLTRAIIESTPCVQPFQHLQG